MYGLRPDSPPENMFGGLSFYLLLREDADLEGVGASAPASLRESRRRHHNLESRISGVSVQNQTGMQREFRAKYMVNAP